MKMFGGQWQVEVFRPQASEAATNPGDSWVETTYNGVDINDFNGGDPFELIISATPTNERARVLQDAHNPGGTTVDHVELATFQLKPNPAEFQTSVLRLDAIDAHGEDVLLLITSADPVSDRINGFDIITVRYVVQDDGTATGQEVE